MGTTCDHRYVKERLEFQYTKLANMVKAEKETCKPAIYSPNFKHKNDTKVEKQ